MKQIPVKLGPLALLLTVITICLVVLATLTYTTAHADKALAEKYAETVSTRTAVEVQGEKLLEEAGKLRAEGKSLAALSGARKTGGVYDVEVSEAGYILSIGLEETSRSYRVRYWKINREWEEDTDIGSLWNGE